MNIEEIEKKQIVADAPTLTVTDVNATAEEALKIMMNFKLHHLLVLEGKNITGIISDRDIFSRAIGKNGMRELSVIHVSEMMRTDFPTVHESTTVREGLSLMVDCKMSALPIMKNGKITGIVTENDMLRAFEKILPRKQSVEDIVAEGESLLAKPFTQNLIGALSEVGL